MPLAVQTLSHFLKQFIILTLFLFQEAICHPKVRRLAVSSSALKSSIQRFVITDKAPTRAFSWLKAATTAFTFKTLLRHYAKQVLTPRSLNVKLGPRCNYHKGRAAIRHYANQPARLPRDYEPSDKAFRSTSQ